MTMLRAPTATKQGAERSRSDGLDGVERFFPCLDPGLPDRRESTIDAQMTKCKAGTGSRVTNAACQRHDSMMGCFRGAPLNIQAHPAAPGVRTREHAARYMFAN